jgi:Permuted papain-like amidase enzyme, YaeF/YiiX, C92 family
MRNVFVIFNRLDMKPFHSLAITLAASIASHALAAGERLEVRAKERTSASCDQPTDDVPLEIQLIDGSQWLLTLDDNEYRGTYVTHQKRKRLVLTPDDASLGALKSAVAMRAARLCGGPIPVDSVAISRLTVFRARGGETGRVTLVARMSGSRRLSLNGTGSFGPLPGAVDLTTDADADGLPDELKEGVDDARAIAAGGDPTQLDESEMEQFAAVIGDLGNRLPLSSRTREIQREILALTADLDGVTIAGKGRRILKHIEDDEAELLDDPDLKLVMDSLDRMLGPAGSLGETVAGGPAAARLPVSTRVAFDQLQRGDVMLLRSSFFYPWVWYFSHAGNYDGNNMVYESLGDGVQLKPLQHWKERGQKVGLGRSNRSSTAQVVAALDGAESRYGTNKRTPYNFFFPNKGSDSAIYCSQLVWKIHKALGVDLDSNDWRWFAQMALKNIFLTPAGVATLTATVWIPAVAPDEIYYSPHINFYSIGTN